VLVTAVLVLAACGSGEDELRRAQLRAEGRNLEETMQRLEDRLLANQARVRFWRELRERHESVTAISCASQDAHAVEMASRLEQTQQREQQHSSLHRAKVAAVSTQPAPVRTTVGK
jgi:hypothetical protein